MGFLSILELWDGTGEGGPMYNKSITFFMVRCVDLKDPRKKTVMCMVTNFITFCFPRAQEGSHDVTGLFVLICKFPENELNFNFYLNLLGIFNLHFCRPQHSCGKVMFAQACVKNSVHRGVSASVHAGIHTPTSPGRHPSELAQGPKAPRPISIK